jgi:hypothetical protein
MNVEHGQVVRPVLDEVTPFLELGAHDWIDGDVGRRLEIERLQKVSCGNEREVPLDLR